MEQLERLSLVSRVATELSNHLGVHEPVLAEYIIGQYEESTSFADFKGRVGAGFSPQLLDTLDKLIRALHPKYKGRSRDDAKLNGTNGAAKGNGHAEDKLAALSMPDRALSPMSELSDSPPPPRRSRKRSRSGTPIERRRSSYDRPRSRSPHARETMSRAVGDDCHARQDHRSRRHDDYERDRSRERRRDDYGRDYDRDRHGDGYRSRDGYRQSPERGRARRQAELYQIYRGRVANVKEFGAFVRIDELQRDGLVHVSNITYGQRIDRPEDVLSRSQQVWVKIVKMENDRMSLSMKDVDQATGQDLNPRQQIDAEVARQTRIDDAMQGDDRHPNQQADIGRPKKRLTSPERWEIKQLIAAGALNASQYPDLEEETTTAVTRGRYDEDIDDGQADQEYDVELRDDEPAFLRGQTKRSLELSPIRIVRAPDGTMNRAAMSGAQLAKDRREAREQAAKEAAKKDDAEGGAVRGQDDEDDIRNMPPPERPKVDPNEWRQVVNPRNAVMGRRTDMSIAEQRSSLPVFKLREPFLKAMAENQLLVVVGETGSGKTTQLVQYLAEDGYTRGGRIACTQPRRVAAMSVAKRVAEEVGCRLGDTVGYTIRFEDCTSPATRIKYLTDGMLQRESLIDPDLKQYSVIVLDEAHERTIATDVLFGLLKKAAKRRPDLRIIITSATLDSEKFSKYFFDCPVFTIPGRTYPVEILHSKEPESDYMESALMTVMQIHLSEPAGDILVFLTGQEEIDSACEILYERMKSLGSNVPELVILPIYSSLPSETQARVFEPAPPGARKVVLATNIAETSITIDGIYFVVDPGFVKQNAYDAKLGMDSLVVTPISQAQARQRAGRAGRTGPGKCFRLYTEVAFRTEMLPATVPEIQRQNLSTTILMLKAMGINDLVRFDFMDPPPTQTLLTALEGLYILGALDEEGLLTRMGRKMADFPMEPHLAKVLLASVDMGCSAEILTVIAMLSTGGSVFYRPKDRQQQADERKRRFHRSEGDHLTLLQVYESWRRGSYSKAWCQEHFVNARAMTRARDIRNQLEGIMDRYKHGVVSCGRDTDRVRRALVSGFFTHAAKRDPQEGYKTVVEGTPVYIHPSSALFGKSSEWVIYHELVATTKEYMHCTTAVEPKWLPELAPAFFKVADANTVSRAKARDRIAPLFDRRYTDANKEAWRISKQKGAGRAKGSIF